MRSFTNEQKQQQLPCCLSHQFFKAATLKPEKIAVIHAASPPPPLPDGHRNYAGPSTSPPTPPVYEGDQSFTFDQVLKSVNSLASHLRSILDGANDDPCLSTPRSSSGNRGECTPSFVPRERQLEKIPKNAYRPKIFGIYMPPSVEYIVSVFSVLRCGEAFLPLDFSWPRERIMLTISSSNVDVIITSASSFGKVGGKGELDELDWLVEGSACPVVCYNMEENLEDCGVTSQLAWPCEKEECRLFCYLMYTSGSTGKPKGVCGTEEGLLNRFVWMQELYPLCGEEVLFFKTPVGFIDHLQELLNAMLAASALVIPPWNRLKEYPPFVINFLQAYSITRLIAVPSLMRALLPTLQSQNIMRIQHSLKLLVISGEVFPLSLWRILSNLLPRTAILNLYGSTEVSGDCTYFDCKRLPAILETETLASVPIGVPISNCDVLLIGKTGAFNEGEIHVGGLCICRGYFSESIDLSSEFVKVHKNVCCKCPEDASGCPLYYRTGDFARQLQGGDLVFMGRTDRTIKVNGQRISLDEIEITLREHPGIVDAAVISYGYPENCLLQAFLLLRDREKTGDSIGSSIRTWMVDKVPLAMIPNRFVFIDSLPMSSNGKVDYALLASSAFSNMYVQDESGNTNVGGLLEVIKKEFCNALLIEEVSTDSDFFMMGGNSIAAAHVSYNLGIDIRLLYSFPTPSKLHTALLERPESCNIGSKSTGSNMELNLKENKRNVSYLVSSATPNHLSLKSKEQKNPYEKNDHAVVLKRLKIDPDNSIPSKYLGPRVECLWYASVLMSCSFSRCNKVMYEKGHEMTTTCQLISSVEVPRSRKGFSMQDLWKVHLESCVDASPLIVFKDKDVHIFIGSHAHKFISINAKSGSVQWEAKLEGRIECSAAILSDFSQVVVGCYRGKIYFLDFLNGNICWDYQTLGEVKSQPVVDTQRQLVWCGSHDHNLYGLDYKRHCCIFKVQCGGSVFGSPAIDEVHKLLHVASTSGRVTAISINALPFHSLWECELKVPVFGSLSVCSPSGNVVCCLVDGNVVALSSDGSIVWRCKTGGPVFAGACISHAFPSQVLICSRNGSVYSFHVENGDLLWEYNVGHPITASAYVDEHLDLVSDPSHQSARLICVCTSSGSIHLLCVHLNVYGKEKQPCKDMVQEFGRMELPGDIFSSPVMIGGRIFVGCRDDYLHCIMVKTKEFTDE